ncbi:hypothetical protein T02_9055 [Trichinella nativa]|uniref:Uncharacterized protein n=1 Tax=Trichinella nativa TaxID=6335 RepID=A0A0V1L8T9_9BILA|nr:hypothetical protein T02_9055 [Trichinella nativa]
MKILVFNPRDEVGDDEATSADRTEAPAGCHHSTVTNAFSALDAQYAEARRAQVALEDALPDGEALEATLREWHELSIEVFETRNQVGIFLKEKGNGPAVNRRQTANLTPVAEQSSIHQRGLSDITKVLHLRSCLSGSSLKAIGGVTICAENYRARRIQGLPGGREVQTLKT